MKYRTSVCKCLTRSASSLALKMCSIKTRLFLNSLPLTLEYKDRYLQERNKLNCLLEARYCLENILIICTGLKSMVFKTNSEGRKSRIKVKGCVWVTFDLAFMIMIITHKSKG